MIRKELQHLAVAVNSLTPHPQNVRQGDVGAISESLKHHGQYRPIVVQLSTRHILAGNHTFKAAKALGWKEIACTFVDCDDEQATRILLMDNRANDLASYDDGALAEMLQTLMATDDQLAGTGFDPEDLQQLLEDLGAEQLPTIMGDPDEVPEQVPAKTVPGDVWLLGLHRLMCGDSLNPTDLDRLINGAHIDCLLTDPPYGINLDTEWAKGGGRDYKKVANDDIPFDASFLRTYFANTQEQFWWGANYFHRTLCPDDLDGSWLVWDKRTPETDSVVGAGFELCWSAQKHKQDLLRYHWTNYTSHTNAGFRRAHPTEKPVAMLEEILNRWATKNGTVADLFGGSGSTLIAAHQTNRVAYLMELDPHYCDVICARYQKATGIKPIAEATGNEHDFLT